jgi:hypothetical protein
MDRSLMIVGYGSALGFWRRSRVAAIPHVMEQDGHVYGSRRRVRREMACHALGLCGTDAPLELAVVPGTMRRHDDIIVEREWCGPLGAEQLLRVDDSLAVCRMPVVLAQLGRWLDPIELAQIACEMMGDYGLTPWSADSFVGDIRKLVDHEELRRYASVAHSFDARGSARALEALKVAFPGSRSPRETDLAIFLATSRARGGAGLGGYRLNETIALPRELCDLAGMRSVTPDFIWEGRKAALEYDSDAYHLSPMDKMRDEGRRAALEKMGYHVTVLTNRMLQDDDALNAQLAELARHLGVRRAAPNRRMLDRRHELRDRLFGSRPRGL